MLSGMVNSFFSGIKDMFNYLFKNENKAIRYTAVTSACILMVALLAACLYFLWKTRGVLDEGAKAFTETAKAGREFVLMEKEQKEKIDDPMSNFKVKTGSVDGEITQIVVATEAAKEKLDKFIAEGGSKKYEKKIRELTEKVLSEQHEEADELFETVIKKVPDFCERHYSERDNKVVFEEAMIRELFTYQTLDDFLLSTAYKIDQILYEAVNEELENTLRKIQASAPNLTYLELKKRMPDARTICEGIYAQINNKNLTAEQRTNLGKSVEKMCTGKKGISSGAVLTVLGGIAAGAATAGALIGSIPALIVGGVVGILGIGAGIGGEAMSQAHKAEYDKFELGFKEAIYQKRDEFKKHLGTSVMDIVDNYKKVEFLKNAVIVVDTDDSKYTKELKIDVNKTNDELKMLAGDDAAESLKKLNGLQ